MTWTRLHDACQHHSSRLIMQLAQCFAEEAVMVDDHGSTPLHIAMWGNPPIGVVQALLHACPQTTSDKDIDGNTPLHVAVSHPETSVTNLRALLDACPTAVSIKNKEGLTPLHMACRYAPHNELVIAILIDEYPYALMSRTKMGELAKRRNPNQTSEESSVSLHFVTDHAGKVNLDFSATRYSLDHQVRDGSYPLHMAIQSGAPLSVIQTIIAGDGEALVLTNKFGETPLHLALMDPSNEFLVDLLLKTPASSDLVCSKDRRQGNLPIHIAAANGCSVTTAKQLLLLHPPSIWEQDKDGKTPLMMAHENVHSSEELLRLLGISDHSEPGSE